MILLRIDMVIEHILQLLKQMMGLLKRKTGLNWYSIPVNQNVKFEVYRWKKN
jgi:hypothetical protein